MLTPPLKIDDSNRADHHYLRAEHECLFFYEFTSGQRAEHSPGNQLIRNLKKSVTRKHLSDYRYKNFAIADCASLLNASFIKSAQVLANSIVCPIPPSKIPSDPEYDDRMFQVAQKACYGTGGTCLEIIKQMQTYAAAHLQQGGARPKPNDLEAIYQLSQPLTKSVVILVDDMLTTGAHFVAARNVILRAYPDARVIGFFMTRRALPDPADEFDMLF